jgi:DNA-directed RNA polymerase subunit beta'
MLATNNILSPASGRPIAAPSHDMVLGINFLTKIKTGDKGEGSVFADEDNALVALEYGRISLHAKIIVRSVKELKDGEHTSAGRIIFNRIMPKDWKFLNKDIGKKELSAIVGDCYKDPKYGRSETVRLLDRIMGTGYKYATKSGLSISVADMLVPKSKTEKVEKAQKQVKAIQKQAEQGIITEGERYNKVIDIWTKVTDEVAEELFEEMSAVEKGKVEGGKQKFNSVYLMANSGARGSRQQVRQLAGMRGLMAKPQKKLTGGQGEIIENPITANFREGLSVLEYFISTHGGRKGLSDTALKTADAGYLTRRLVDVGHNLVITGQDCGTSDGVLLKSLMSGEEIIEKLSERVLGRCALEDIVVKDGSKDVVIIKNGDMITAEQAALIDRYEVETVRVRSALTCGLQNGICSKCYGVNLATGNMAGVGDTVGIIAAQSIGEPGTQLTLRTFHIGGAASRVLSRSQAVAEISGKMVFQDVKVISDRFDNKICVSRNGSIFVEDGKGASREYKIQYGAKVIVSDKASVSKDTVMAEWDPHSLPVISEIDGVIKLLDVAEGITLQEERNKVTGIIERKIIAGKSGSSRKNPRVAIEGTKGKFTYPLPVDTILLVESGEEVKTGDVIAKIAKEFGGTKDITGGLPRIAELFEARRPKNPAIIAEFEGVIRLETSPKGLIEVVLRNDEINKEEHYSIPQGKHLVVYEGDRVAVGEALTDGAIDPHDVLRVRGIKEAQEFLLNAIQEVYRLQGVTINDKHIEVIVRQMLGNVRVQDEGDTGFLKGEIVGKPALERENRKAEAAGKKPAQAETILLGISKASLASESFISAASFQETTKVLTDAAIKGQIDRLEGLKENVIVGHLIPAGTGISAREVSEEFKEKEAKLEKAVLAKTGE